MRQKYEIIFEDPSNKCEHHVWNTLSNFSDNGRKYTIFSHFVATRGPKFGQRGSKADQLCTLDQQV